MKFYSVILFLMLLLLSDCGGRADRPSNLMPEDKYVDVLTELQLLKAYQKQQTDSLKVDSLKGAIFQKYGATEQQFQESHAYYQQDMENQEDRLKQAIDQLREDHIIKPVSTDTTDSIRTDTPGLKNGVN